MALYKRGGTWWMKFEYAGTRYRESTGTNSKQLAADIFRERRRAVEAAAFRRPQADRSDTVLRRR